MKHFSISLVITTFFLSFLFFTACQQEQTDSNNPNIQLKSESGFIVADSELALNQLVESTLEELNRPVQFSITKTEIQETEEYVIFYVYFLDGTEVEDRMVFNFSKKTDGIANKRPNGAVICICSCTEGSGKCQVQGTGSGGCLCAQNACEGDCALSVTKQGSNS